MRYLVALLIAGSVMFGENFIESSAVQAQDKVVSKGQFSGRSGHKVSGTVQIIQTESEYRVQFQNNFRLDGAPGPYLGFGNGGKYARSTEFSKLRKIRGSQSYKIPNKIDVSKFDTFIIWCKPYKVPLAVATLR